MAKSNLNKKELVNMAHQMLNPKPKKGGTR